MEIHHRANHQTSVKLKLRNITKRTWRAKGVMEGRKKNYKIQVSNRFNKMTTTKREVFSTNNNKYGEWRVFRICAWIYSFIMKWTRKYLKWHKSYFLAIKIFITVFGFKRINFQRTRWKLFMIFFLFLRVFSSIFFLKELNREWLIWTQPKNI